MADFVEPKERPILVTGALGFLGSNLVKQLLIQGYYVRGAVRASAEFPSLVNHLRVCTMGTPGKFEIFQMDLLSDDEKWEKVLDGVQCVYHLASAQSCVSDNTESEMLLPNVEGTRRLLEFCQKSPTVKKFIYSSCYVTLAHDFDSKKNYTECDFNEGSTLNRHGYAFTKTLADKLVLAFGNQPNCHFTVVSIVSGVLLGPPVVPLLSYSHDYIKVFLDGTVKRVVDLHYPIADVRDVAGAFITALQNPTISGRYCLANSCISVADILHIIQTNFPEIANLPTRPVPNLVAKTVSAFDSTGNGEFVLYFAGRRININSARATSAGMYLRSSQDSIIDTVRYFLDYDCLKAPSADVNKKCTIS